MVNITLPDGSVRSYEGSKVTGNEIAESIGAGLAKAAIAIRVNGKDLDLSREISEDSEVSILTLKDEGGLDAVRHSLTAHILARAVKELYPDAQLAIGPTVDNGAYYDIAFKKVISSDDLPKIEKKMRQLVEKQSPITRQEWPAEKVKEYFASQGEDYKVKLVEDLIAQNNLIDGERLSVYVAGDDAENFEFLDLCVGPHVQNFKQIKLAFKLTNLAGAYWRGDANNEQLTRIYMIAFPSQKELDEYLHMKEEAERRDHRKIAREMDLFHFQDEAPGQVFWHHNGWVIYRQLMDYMREKLEKYDYIEVNTPQMLDSRFWQASGHWDKYQENMFVVEDEEEAQFPYALKPMSCPGNAQLFMAKAHSYRNLPLRMAEFGHVFRRESSGARHGLMRVQAFTQDDAHIFCTDEQLEDEVVIMCDLIQEVYTDLGMAKDIMINFSTRPEQRIGSDEDWDRAENALQKVLDRIGMQWQMNAGDGAFYAPKLDFILTDAIGRQWQCGTVQVDMNMPTRLNLQYIGSDGEPHKPHMVHRAILGSVERFIGVMIEHFAGHFPLWLAPVQVVVSGIVENHNDHVEKVYRRLRDAGLRVEADYRNEKINYKIREHMHAKVNMVGVVGDKEAAEDSITIRRLGSEGQVTYKLDEFIAMCKNEIETKALPASFLEKQKAA